MFTEFFAILFPLGLISWSFPSHPLGSPRSERTTHGPCKVIPSLLSLGLCVSLPRACCPPSFPFWVSWPLSWPASPLPTMALGPCSFPLHTELLQNRALVFYPQLRLQMLVLLESMEAESHHKVQLSLHLIVLITVKIWRTQKIIKNKNSFFILLEITTLTLTVFSSNLLKILCFYFLLIWEIIMHIQNFILLLFRVEFKKKELDHWLEILYLVFLSPFCLKFYNLKCRKEENKL